MAKLIIFTDNIQLCLVKWHDDGRRAETSGRNKIEYINIVVSDGNQQNILLSFSKVNTLSDKEADFLCSNLFQLLTRTTGNSMNNGEFLKFVIYVKRTVVIIRHWGVLTAE